MSWLNMDKVWSWGDIEVQKKDNPDGSVYLTNDNLKDYIVDNVISESVLINSKSEIEEYLDAITKLKKYISSEAESTMAKYEGMEQACHTCLNIISKHLLIGE